MPILPFFKFFSKFGDIIHLHGHQKVLMAPNFDSLGAPRHSSTTLGVEDIAYFNSRLQVNSFCAYYFSATFSNLTSTKSGLFTHLFPTSEIIN